MDKKINFYLYIFIFIIIYFIIQIIKKIFRKKEIKEKFDFNNDLIKINTLTKFNTKFCVIL